MEDKKLLQDAVDKVQFICDKIVKKENYAKEMPACVQAVQAGCLKLLEKKPTDGEVLPLLEDMMYGMTQQDEVFLLDVLRFGIREKLKRELESIYE